MHIFSQSRLVAAVLLGTSCFGGCQTLDLKTDWDWYGNDKIKVPNKIVCLWTDTVRIMPDNPSVRGFGGRVYFYEHGNPKPIKVDGQLIVYAFDDTGFDPRYSKPVRHFIFPADTFAEHHSESELGHSYSFFLPWDGVGGERAELALIARFQPNGGQLVMSDASRMTLPGTVVANAEETAAPLQMNPALRQVGYEAPPVSKPRMRTDTINLPPGTFSSEGNPAGYGCTPLPVPYSNEVHRLPPQNNPAAPSDYPNTAAPAYPVSPNPLNQTLPSNWGAGIAAPPTGLRVPQGTANSGSVPGTGGTPPQQQSDTMAVGQWVTQVSYTPISWKDRAEERPLSRSAPGRFRAPRLTADQPRFDHGHSQPYPSTPPSAPQYSPPPAQGNPNWAYSPGDSQAYMPSALPAASYR